MTLGITNQNNVKVKLSQATLTTLIKCQQELQ